MWTCKKETSERGHQDNYDYSERGQPDSTCKRTMIWEKIYFPARQWPCGVTKPKPRPQSKRILAELKKGCSVDWQSEYLWALSSTNTYWICKDFSSYFSPTLTILEAWTYPEPEHTPKLTKLGYVTSGENCDTATSLGVGVARGLYSAPYYNVLPPTCTLWEIT